MSHSVLSKRLSSLTICDSCAHRLVRTFPQRRSLSTTSPNPITPPPGGYANQGGLGRMPDLLNPKTDPLAIETIFGTRNPSGTTTRDLRPPTYLENILPQTYHLHVLATKHNTHLTLTKPNRNPMLSLSTGNLSFRKSNRGTYDAAYQLVSYFLGRVQEQGWMKDIEYSEIVLRGFGVGREAVVKCLMGSEGMVFRGTVVRVGDHTRLKFGGTRARKPRRLG